MLNWHRIRRSWRCKIGIHRWEGHRDCGDGVNVAPYEAYSNPVSGCWRVCSWCGARARAAYDPLYGRSFWQRTS